MATIKAEVSKHHKKKDGTIPVKIRVTHKQQIRRLPTNLVAYPEDLTRDYKIKGNLRRRCDALVKEMYDAMADISYFDMQKCDVDFIVRHIKSKLEKEDWHLNFFSFAEEYLKDAPLTESTKDNYRVALSALERYLGRRELDINEITLSLLNDFEAFLAKEKKYHYDKKSGKTVASSIAKRRGAGSMVYFAKLAKIFKAAKEKYNDEDVGDIRIPRSPFERLKIKAAPSEGQEALSLEVIRLMIHDEPTAQSERDALDIFLISLGLMGANMADLYEANQPGAGDIWIYHRAKTRTRRKDKAEMRVRIPEYLYIYIKRLSVGTSKGKWLNISHRFATAGYATAGTNKALRSWAKKHGLPEFSFYAARKTWATIAGSKGCGIDKALIDECLAHVGHYKIADIYIQRDWERLWEANEKVCKYIWGI